MCYEHVLRARSPLGAFVLGARVRLPAPRLLSRLECPPAADGGARTAVEWAMGSGVTTVGAAAGSWAGGGVGFAMAAFSAAGVAATAMMPEAAGALS